MLSRALRTDTQHARSHTLNWEQLAFGLVCARFCADIQHARSWRYSRPFARTLSTPAVPNLAGSRLLPERFCKYALQCMVGCARAVSWFEINQSWHDFVMKTRPGCCETRAEDFLNDDYPICPVPHNAVLAHNIVDTCLGGIPTRAPWNRVGQERGSNKYVNK